MSFIDQGSDLVSYGKGLCDAGQGPCQSCSSRLQSRQEQSATDGLPGAKGVLLS